MFESPRVHGSSATTTAAQNKRRATAAPLVLPSPAFDQLRLGRRDPRRLPVAAEIDARVLRRQRFRGRGLPALHQLSLTVGIPFASDLNVRTLVGLRRRRGSATREES